MTVETSFFGIPEPQAIFGYNESEAIGKPLNTIIPQRYHGLHRDTIARLKAGGETRVVGKSVELEGLRKDGAEFPIEFTLSIWKTNQGQFYTGILRDITRRKQAEDALKSSESRLAEAQRVAHVGSWEWDIVTQTGVLLGGTVSVIWVRAGRIPGQLRSFPGLRSPGGPQAGAEMVKGIGRGQCVHRDRGPDYFAEWRNSAAA